MATFLVVDDEPDVRRMFGFVLEGAGHRMLEATNGVEAIEVLDTASVDVVISDLNMPVMDGLALRDALSASHPDLPFVLWSAAHDLRTFGGRSVEGLVRKDPFALDLDALASRVGAAS